MNSIQIEKLLQRQPRCACYFLGCFAADRIPRHADTYPWCAVVNTDCAHESGTHWVALYVPHADCVEYFDSLGQPPNETIANYLDKEFPATHVRINTCALQSLLSKVCGKYAIYFLMRRCAGDSFETVVRRLSTARTNPDRLVAAYVARLFHDEWDHI